MRRAALCVGLVLTSFVVSLPAVALEAGSHVAFAPKQGPVGTLITIRGHLTPSDEATSARADSVTLYIVAGQSNAGLETSGAVNMRRGQGGGFTLSFRFPDRTDWRANPMSGSDAHLSRTPVPTLVEVAWPCRACALGTFQVTEAALPSTGIPTLVLIGVGVLLLVTGGLALTIPRAR